MTKRMLLEPDKRLLARFAVNFAWHGRRAMAEFRRRTRRGLRSPAFLFISLTDRCNLHCQGCWVTPCDPAREWPPEKLDAVINEYKQTNRSRFFGLLGGEPLLYPHLMEVIARHPDCYFQVLTNGTLLDDAVARDFRRLGNVTPLISVEGNPAESDRRRGGQNVHRSAMEALAACRRHRLIFGVAASICRTNIDDLVREDFLRDMIARGALYLWYYIYRPVGPRPAPELALREQDILRLRRFLVDARPRFPIMLIDAYWDADGRALCPAAEGISHHLGPGGDLEPCPPIQFSGENLADGSDINRLFQQSQFLHRFRETAAAQGRGCILLENPLVLHDFLKRTQARDTTGRADGLREIAAMRACAGHDLPGREIPERHWLYRFAKQNWFFGFGAYG
ncbi:MAG: radical SAM/SPASM domain-containing protein [Kiritimatiellia bacterium]